MNDANIFILDECKIDIENEMKYVSVILDNELTFDKNCALFVQKIGQKQNWYFE